MSRKASEFQYKVMSLAYSGKEVFKPLGTGWIDERDACVRDILITHQDTDHLGAVKVDSPGLFMGRAEVLPLMLASSCPPVGRR